MKSVILAHYYCTQDVQAIADRVGDSLDLSQYAAEADADRIVFAGVRFMAETAKILSPSAEVILPDSESTCSLVTQTDIKKLEQWDIKYKLTSEKPSVHIAYINSSVEHKAIADLIVTSRNVQDIVKFYGDKGYRILFSPDRNMGAFLKQQFPNYEILLWDAVCEVHDKFKEEELEKAMRHWTDGPKYIIAHPESPLPVLNKANFVGSTSQMLDWVKNFNGSIGTIYVATEDGLLPLMKEARPDLDIRLAPTYAGCQCNSCPYMKKNTVSSVQDALRGVSGEVITIDENLITRARASIEGMFKF